MLYRLSYVGGAAASRFYPVAVATPPDHDVNARWVDSVRDDLRTGKKEIATSNVALSFTAFIGLWWRTLAPVGGLPVDKWDVIASSRPMWPCGRGTSQVDEDYHSQKHRCDGNYDRHRTDC